MSHKFHIGPMTDAEIFAAVKDLQATGLFTLHTVEVTEFPNSKLHDLEKDPNFQAILEMSERAFPKLHFMGQDGVRLTVDRAGVDAPNLYDTLTLAMGSSPAGSAKARLIAEARRRFKPTVSPGLVNLLGKEAADHLKAREEALLRLERVADQITLDTNAERARQEQVFRDKEKAADERFAARMRDIDEHEARQRKALEDERAALLADIQKREESLKALKKEIDDLAAKHTRRKLFEKQEDRLKDYEKQFFLSAGTSLKRLWVTAFTLILLGVFGWQAWDALQVAVSATDDTTKLVSALVTKAVFTALFVSTAFFFIRWNGDWVRRHADEEFRLKRLAVDMIRASWFVEMAFEWKEEKGEAIPEELIQRLTHGLFADGSPANDGETDDSLMRALLGASKASFKFGDGTGFEYDPKALKKLGAS